MACVNIGFGQGLQVRSYRTGRAAVVAFRDGQIAMSLAGRGGRGGGSMKGSTAKNRVSISIDVFARELRLTRTLHNVIS